MNNNRSHFFADVVFEFRGLFGEAFYGACVLS